MPFPYHKMNEQDFAYFKTFIDSDRIIEKDDIKSEYYHDEMPEYGVFAPDLLIDAQNKEEISKVMKYAYENNIPVTARGAGTGLAGGATCKFGGFCFCL
ncbi:FAD-binding protein [Eubacteriaceae bacterium ES2]|nr:FAD-binding protein [Eubacteriaceae bacterium ES2]